MGKSRSPKPPIAVVLAAGHGTRMLSPAPKVIHSLYGKPLVGHVLDAIRGAGVRRIIAVIGYRSDLVQELLGPGVETVFQRSLKGTGHAVSQALPRLAGFQGDLLVLYGDTPLITAQTVKELIDTHRLAQVELTLLTAHLKEPAGYGRIVRDRAGRIVRIVEEADASLAERAIEEINVGAYCFKISSLRQALREIRPSPKGEIYLTDAVSIVVQRGGRVASASTRLAWEFLGVNTRADLARVQTIMRGRILTTSSGPRHRGPKPIAIRSNR